ncbi:MAG: hypothetical protein ACT4P6_01855 [Gemmatimonadaceae bacterium]
MTPLRVLLMAVVAIGSPFYGGGVLAQERDELRSVRARAIRAQQQFETYRRRQLPVTYGRSAASDCDLRIGRFCYWHDADSAPAEPGRIAAARDALLRALDSMAIRAPDDGWVAGQRVRYLVEAGRPIEAVRAATACSGDPWWCGALFGFAQHALGAYAAADSAFERSIAEMPATRRCAWTDLSDLLPGGFHKAYRALPCEQRDSVNAQVWWLADPRWSSGGNDLRSEFYSRLTMAQLVQQARSAHDMAWGDDMAELMLRYGWPTSWSRSPPSSYDPTRVAVVGHEPSPSFDFLPSARALHDPLRAELTDWTPLAPLPTTRYAPPYAKHFRELSPQVAWFARGDSAALVVGYDVRRERDTVFTQDSVDAAVVLSRGANDLSLARALSGLRGDAVIIPSTRAPLLVSVEVSDSAARAVARGRMAVRPPADSTLSDLLLFDGAGGLPETFEGVARSALGTLTVSREVPFGVYWELYGALAQARDVSYSLNVEPMRPGLLRRLAERVRLTQPMRSVQLTFDDGRPASSRSLLVDVSHIPQGRYRLTLRVSASQTTAQTSREIQVRDRRQVAPSAGSQ